MMGKLSDFDSSCPVDVALLSVLPSSELWSCLYLCRYFLFNIAKKIAPVVVMFLPKNVNLDQLAEMALSSNPPWSLEVRIFIFISQSVVNYWHA